MLNRTLKFAAIGFFLLIFVAGNLFGATINFRDGDYLLELNYNETAKPGDAVYVRLDVSGGNKIIDDVLPPQSGTLSLFRNGKTVRTAKFFNLSPIGNAKSLLAGVPLSSWWTREDSFSIEVSCSVGGRAATKIYLPFELENKIFVSETIPLDDTNTSIKTDSSDARMKQIEKLNALLATVDSSAVYQDGNFIPPTSSVRHTSFFADRRVYAYSSGGSSTSLHYGIDYGIGVGNEVRSCATGKVVMAEWRNSTGWSIVVEHLPGLYSLYYHLSEMLVKEGDFVKAGDLIAKSGCTGLATGPHLHWEMRLNGEAVNPNFFTSNFGYSKRF